MKNPEIFFSSQMLTDIATTKLAIQNERQAPWKPSFILKDYTSTSYSSSEPES